MKKKQINIRKKMEHQQRDKLHINIRIGIFVFYLSIEIF